MKNCYWKKTTEVNDFWFGEPLVTYTEIKFFKVFYLYKKEGLWWFRIFGSWGLHGKNLSRHLETFSDRYSKRRVKVGTWIYKVLAPPTKKCRV